MAVDRKLFADTVFLGAGVPVYGPETPANKQWYWPDAPQTPHDPAAARSSCSPRSGSTDRNGDGLLEDAHEPAGALHAAHAEGTAESRARRRGHPRRAEEDRRRRRTSSRSTAGALIDQLRCTRKYEAVYFNADKTDLDPAINPDFWFSSGSAHIWNLGQKTPATEWERRIDELMARQIAVARRSRAQAPVRRGAEDLRRAPADRLLRRAAHLSSRTRRA